MNTRISLADGRELIYYDEAPGTVRVGSDTRTLPAFSARSEIRYDALLDQWVIIAGHRQERTHLPAASDCPLCPSINGRLSEIPASDYDVVVFENRFPALSGSAGSTEPNGCPVDLQTDTPLTVRHGIGRCEVVCFTSAHDGSFAQLSRSRARLVVEVWDDRCRTIATLPGIEQIFCFENRGAEIGVTEPHPHGQIYGYPFVTPRTARMIDSAAAYRARTGDNLFDTVLRSARATGSRMVVEGEHWCGFVPHAARWPYEVHLYPTRRVPDIPALNDSEKDDFVTVYLDLLNRFDRLFGRPAPYISAWHQAPLRSNRDEFALHLELFTSRRGPEKLKYLAGSESAMDVFVGDIVPEEAAQRLRDLA